MRKCQWCGGEYDTTTASHTGYCSQKCVEAARKGQAAKKAAQTAGFAQSSADTARLLRVFGIIFVGVGTVIAGVFYMFPKFLKQKNIKFLYAYIIVWAVLIVFSLIYFLIIRPRMGL